MRRSFSLFGPAVRFHSGAERGVGLVEVLLSVMILASGILFVYRPLLASVSSLNYLDTRSEAVRLLGNRMWEYSRQVAQGGLAAAGAGRESLMGGERVYQCRADAFQIAARPALYRVDFKMKWLVGSQSKSISRSIYVLEPERKS